MTKHNVAVGMLFSCALAVGGCSAGAESGDEASATSEEDALTSAKSVTKAPRITDATFVVNDVGCQGVLVHPQWVLEPSNCKANSTTTYFAGYNKSLLQVRHLVQIVPLSSTAHLHLLDAPLPLNDPAAIKVDARRTGLSDLINKETLNRDEVDCVIDAVERAQPAAFPHSQASATTIAGGYIYRAYRSPLVAIGVRQSDGHAVSAKLNANGSIASVEDEGLFISDWLLTNPSCVRTHR
jgi:hypothetical protein